LPPGIEKTFGGFVGTRAEAFSPHEGSDGGAGGLVVVNDGNDNAIHSWI
jgi:hypothetical protein